MFVDTEEITHQPTTRSSHGMNALRTAPRSCLFLTAIPTGTPERPPYPICQPTLVSCYTPGTSSCSTKLKSPSTHGRIYDIIFVNNLSAWRMNVQSKLATDERTGGFPYVSDYRCRHERLSTMPLPVPVHVPVVHRWVNMLPPRHPLNHNSPLGGHGTQLYRPARAGLGIPHTKTNTQQRVKEGTLA